MPTVRDDDEPERLPRWLVPVALAALVAGPYLPAILTGRAPFHRDISDHMYPLRLSIHRAWTEGRIPGWDGQLFCGSPLLAQPEASVFYPVTMLTDWIHPAYTIVPQILIHLGIGCTLLYAAIRARGLGVRSGLVAATVFAMSGVGFMTVQQIANLRTLCWVPGALLGVEWIRQRHRTRGLAMVGLCGGMAILGGYPPHFLYACFGLGAVLLTGLPWTPGNDGPGGPRAAAAEALRRSGWFLGGLVLAGAIGAVQMLPTLHFVGLSQRQLGLAPELADSWAAKPQELMYFLYPRVDVRGGYATSGYGYVGYVTLLLGGLAFLRGRPGARLVLPWTMVLVILTLGARTEIGRAFQALPFMSYFRNPTHFLYVVNLLAAWLAAEGIEALEEREPPGGQVSLLVGTMAMLWIAAIVTPFPDTGARVFVYAALLLASAGAFVFAARRLAPLEATSGAWLCIAVLAVDLWFLGGRYNVREHLLATYEEIRTDPPALRRVAQEVRERPGRVVTGDAEFNWDNAVVQAGLDNVRGLRALAPLRTLDVMRIANEGAPFPREPARTPLYDYAIHDLQSPVANLVGLRYAAGFERAPASNWNDLGDGAFAGPGDGATWRWFPYATAVGADGDCTAALASRDFRAERTLFVHTSRTPVAGPIAAAPGIDVRDAETRVDVRLSEHGGGWLFWSQSHDPGWSVTVDGAPAEVVRAQHAFMAVHVPAGARDLTFRYVPPGLAFGAALSVLGLVACGLAFRMGERRAGPVGARRKTPADAP